MVTTSLPLVFGASTLRYRRGGRGHPSRHRAGTRLALHHVRSGAAVGAAPRRSSVVPRRHARDGCVRLAASRLAHQDASLPVALFRVPVGRVLVAWVSREPRRGRDAHLRVSARGRQRQVCRDRRAAPFRRRPRGGAGRLRRGIGRLHRAVCGKIEVRKQPLDAVRAVASLGPNAVLAVAGSGDLQQAMRAEAERLGVRVTWLGFVNQSAMARLYAGADCLVLPSGANRGGWSSTKPWRRAFRRWRRTASAAHRI